MRSIIKPFDFVIVLALLALAFIIYFLPASDADDMLCIYIDGELDRCIDLTKDEYSEFEITSEFGFNKIIIESGKVRVSESSCDNKLEIKAGEISRSGQSLICLPNRLVVTIEGKDEYDAVTY